MKSNAANIFLADLRQRLDYFRAEFTLSYCEAIGCLEMLKHELLLEVAELEDGEE